MAKIQIKRGQQSNVQNLVLAPGELAVALDSGNVYVGTDTGKVHINPSGGTAAGNIPVLGPDGKLDSAVIPSIALSDIFTVENEAGMLGLTAQTGDVAIRTDENKTYILSAEPASAKANWKQILTPTASVQSVNGKTGVVTLTAEDVGATDENVKIETVSLNEFGSNTYAIPFTDATSTNTGHLKIRRTDLTLTGGAGLGATLTVSNGGGVVKAGSFTGKAASANTADKLKTVRTIGISGGITGTATSFDGSCDITIPVTAIDPTKLSAATPIAKGGTGATTAAAALTNLGLSATATELNYCDGVTSNIQDQLDTIKSQDIDGGVF